MNAQPLRSECAVIAQWVRSITHIDYAVLRSECAAITQRYAVIPLCVMAGFTQITQSLRRRQLADDVLVRASTSSSGYKAVQEMAKLYIPVHTGTY